MADPSSKQPSSRLVYDGAVFRVEFYVAPGGAAPAEVWLEQLPLGGQQKFAALFARMGDTGKIWNERKFKHLTETDQIFEFSNPVLFLHRAATKPPNEKSTEPKLARKILKGE